MSAHGSPTASAGDGGLSGADLALRMIQAAEAAATAAKCSNRLHSNTMTSTSSTTGQTGNTGGDSRTEWYKVLPKPGVFEPRDREAELATFRGLVVAS